MTSNEHIDSLKKLTTLPPKTPDEPILDQRERVRLPQSQTPLAARMIEAGIWTLCILSLVVGIVLLLFP